MRMLKRILCLFVPFLMAVPAHATTTKAAVFPFGLHDAQQDGEIVPQYNPEDLRRLKVVVEELKALMAKDGKYAVVDLAPHAKEVEAASPFDQCNGADIAVTGFVDKVSDALLSLRIVARDTKTGELTKTMSAAINGNTDELWLHGVRYLWRNRFNVEAQPK